MDGLSHEKSSFLYRQEYLVSFGLNLVFYGMYASLMLFLIYHYHQSPKQQRSTTTHVLLFLIMLMFVFRTIQIICEWIFIWLALIKHGGTAEEVYDALYGVNSDARFLPLIANLMTVLKLAVADSIMVWRCWIICGRSWKVAITPFILNICSIAIGLTSVIIHFISVQHTLSIHIFAIAVYFNIINVTLSVATTVISTIIIAVRILNMSCSVPGKRYSRVGFAMEIIVESATLYSVAALIWIPFELLDYVGSPKTIEFTLLNVFYAETFFTIMVNVAPALIMLRVVLGTARPDAAWSGELEKTSINLQFPTIPVSPDLAKSMNSECQSISPNSTTVLHDSDGLHPVPLNEFEEKETSAV